MNRNIQIRGLSTLALATIVLVLLSFLIQVSPRQAVIALLMGSGLQSMAAFYALTWAIPRSDKAFFSVFIGDALVRLLVLAAAVYGLHIAHTPYALPLLSLAMGYLVL